MAPTLTLLIIAFPICGLIGFYIKTKNQERMKLIENGINPDEGVNILEYRKFSNLKNGILFVFIGLGLLVGHILVINFNQMDSLITYITMIFIFGGIGFLLSYNKMKNWNPQ